MAPVEPFLDGVGTGVVSVVLFDFDVSTVVDFDDGEMEDWITSLTGIFGISFDFTIGCWSDSPDTFIRL